MGQPALIPHGAESQQRPEGFACPGAGKHQQVEAAALELEPAPQQLDQLLLPLPWLNEPWLNLSLLPLAGLDLVRGLPGREVEADGWDITSREDESF